ncbi:DUF397 domain-containing protein [Nonomuraea aurantiaca]|uniref:DUF397 domain-containing protein n=1 Tax=Nonomuraea aurantiaca TaxID=2878562 RepID=UPI001CD9CB77|nr:DUF397 domain-containing protein [Nonomuraea aurantiaca]MCA2220879.1 DUF397 domain-containing protein [Nonomuraea aurantiaca]
MIDEELSGATWRKATASGGTGGNCVEVAPLSGGRVGVRHSQHPDGPVLVYTKAEWDAFRDGMSKGEFDF